MNQDSMLFKYNLLNTSYRKKMIYNFGSSAGFYSEFNNMVLAIIYCLDNGIQFCMYSNDAIFCYDKGWRDYFEPFCPETKSYIHHLLNRRWLKGNSFILILRKICVITHHFFYPNIYFTSDIFDEFHNRKMEEKLYTFDELNIYNKDLRETTSIIINMIYRFNPKIENKIIEKINGLSLPKEYIGFHIRRGDKSIEHDVIPIDQYILKAINLSNIRNAFVLTDDYRTFEELVDNYSYEWSFHTLTSKNEKGYILEKAICQPADMKISDMVKLFASMRILSNATFFIGTFSANPGMFLGMYCDREKVYGVDLDMWQIW